MSGTWNRRMFNELYSGHYEDWRKTREDTDDEVDDSKTEMYMTCECKVKLYNKEGRQLYERFISFDDEDPEYFEKIGEKVLKMTRDEYYSDEFPHLKK